MGSNLRFLTRQGCHLCEDALDLLRGIPLEIVDVDLDLTLLEQYDERVPVLLDPATGIVLLEGRITADQVAMLTAT
jgi:glutaredoxin